MHSKSQQVWAGPVLPLQYPGLTCSKANHVFFVQQHWKTGGGHQFYTVFNSHSKGNWQMDSRIDLYQKIHYFWTDPQLVSGLCNSPSLPISYTFIFDHEKFHIRKMLFSRPSCKDSCFLPPSAFPPLIFYTCKGIYIPTPFCHPYMAAVLISLIAHTSVCRAALSKSKPSGIQGEYIFLLQIRCFS